MLSARGITHSYGDRPVLEDVTAEVDEGEVLGLIGPNGSGKTTLLRTMHGAIRPQAGSVVLDGRPIGDYTRREVARRIAVVVQEPVGEVPLTVADTVLLGRTPQLGLFQRPARADRRVAQQALARVGVEHLVRRAFTQLSGGEKQRVMIARALAQQSRYLLMDEPTNHLDVHFQHEVLHRVRSIGLTTVVVLHDLNLAARYCDRLVLLDHGRVVATGTPEDVYRAELLGRVHPASFESVRASDGTVPTLHQHAHEANRTHLLTAHEGAG